MPGSDFLTFDRGACDRPERVAVDDAGLPVADARTFFIAHSACRAVIDPAAALCEGWRVPSRAGAGDA